MVASSAAWLEKYRNQVETCLRSIHGINHINWRPSLDVLKEDGFDISSLTQAQAQSSSLPQRSMVRWVFGLALFARRLNEYGRNLYYSALLSFLWHWQVVENGISYAVSLEGQKTGFYTDQRENRHFVSTISAGKRVLDLCCYSGGFALNAARGGATSVVGTLFSLSSS